MNDTKKKRWDTESIICAIAGGFIGEMARQMVQFDHVSVWRVLILITAALVAGFVCAFSFLSSRQNSAVQNKSHKNELYR